MLRLVADRLSARAVQVYAAPSEDASLALLAGVGGLAEAPGLAEAVGPVPDEYVVTGAVEGADLAVAVGLSAGGRRGAFLVFDPPDLDDAWWAAFEMAADAVVGLIGDPAAEVEAPSTAIAPVLQQAVVHNGPLDDTLRDALRTMAERLGLDAAVLSRVEGRTWTPHVVVDPSGVLPDGPVPIASMLCAVPFQTGQTIAVDDTQAAGLAFEQPAAYIGAAVSVAGRRVGTLSVVGARPRPEPFTDADREAVEGVARWVGDALEHRSATRKLAEYEGLLAALNGQPLAGIGTVEVSASEFDVDALRCASLNDAAATAFGLSREACAGRPLADLGIAERHRSRWVQACQAAAAGVSAEPFEFEVERGLRTRTLSASVAAVPAADAPEGAGGHFVFVVTPGPDRSAAVPGSVRAALLTRVDYALRSPMTSVIGFADLLTPESTPEEVAEARDVILRAGRSLFDALDGLMDLALLESDDIVVTLAPTDPAALVSEAVDAHRMAAAAYRTRIHTSIQRPHVPVLLDADLVRRVVRRLLGRAVIVPDSEVDVTLVETTTEFELVVDRRGAAGDETLVGEAVGPALVRRIVDALGGSVEEAAERWTVRLPRHPAVLVDLAPQGGAGGDGEVPELIDARTLR